MLSSIGEAEEWEKAERKLLQRISSARAKSVADFKAKKSKRGKFWRNPIFTFKSVMYTILAVCCMQRQYRSRKVLFYHSDSEHEIESHRRRKKAMEVRSVRMLMKIPKQDPLSWITTQPPKTGAQQNKLNKSNLALLHPGLK